MKRNATLFLLMLLTLCSRAQLIKGYEYWVDDNVSLKTSASITPVKTLRLQQALPLNQVSSGMHMFYIRFADNANNWSGPVSQLFVMNPPATFASRRMVGYEYWFDNNDASRTYLAVSPAALLHLAANLDLGNLAMGYHLLNIRFKDDLGSWSVVISQFFVKDPPTTSSSRQVVAYEYWVDNGYAARTYQPVTPASLFHLAGSLNLGQASPGFHVINLRFKDDLGNWSSTLTQLFTKFGVVRIIPNNIVSYRFWYDNDMNTLVTANFPQPVTIGHLADSLETPFLTVGNHTFNYQFKDSAQAYSSIRTDTFSVASCLPHSGHAVTGAASVCAGQTGVIYTIRAVKNATGYVWTIPPGATAGSPGNTNSIVVNYPPGATSGNVTVYATNSCGNGPTVVYPVTVHPLPQPTLSGPATVCTGATGQVYTTESGNSDYTWSVAPGNTITAGGTSTSPTATVTWNSQGSQWVKVNYTSVFGCRDTTDVKYNVMVQPPPAATITGPSTCCVSVAGTYTTEPGMTGYVWTVSSGGTISSGQSTSGISVTWSTGGTGSVTVIYINPAGCSPAIPASVAVTVNTVPQQPGIISGTHDVAVGQTAVPYSVAAVPNATGYVWSLPAGATIALGSNTNTITVNFPPNLHSGNITVYATNGCGNSLVSPALDITMHRYAPTTITGNVCSLAGSGVVIPVKTVNFQMITAFVLLLEYDPSKASLTGFSGNNPQLAGILVNIIPVSSSLRRVFIVWSNPYPVSLADSSGMFNLNFSAYADSSSFVWNNTLDAGHDCEYSDEYGNYMIDTPTPAYYINGSFWPCFNITGKVTYNNQAATPMDSVRVTLKKNGIRIDSTRTNLAGNYSFPGKATGLYTINARTNKPWGSVNATDAVKIERHFVGLETFTIPVRIQAADVNFSNSINGTDALKVKRRFVGLDSTFARGDWTFAKPTGGDTVIVANASVIQDLQALCVGDVNGSYLPATGVKSAGTLHLNTNSKQFVHAGEVVEVAARIGVQASLGAFSLVFGYPSSSFNLLSASSPGESMLSNILPGQLRLAWSGLQPLTLGEGDDLVTLKLRMNEDFPPGSKAFFTLGVESELADPAGEVLSIPELQLPELISVAGTNAPPGTEMVSDMQVYPNPVKDMVTLLFTIPVRCSVDLKVIDPLGRVIYADAGEADQGVVKRKIDLAKFQPGCYYVKMEVKSSLGVLCKVRKIVKM